VVGGKISDESAEIIIAAAANLAKAGNLDPRVSSHLLLNNKGGGESLQVADDLNIEGAREVITLMDGHGSVENSTLDNDKVGVGVTAVGDGEVDGVQLLQRLHLPWLEGANCNKNKSSKNKGTHSVSNN